MKYIKILLITIYSLLLISCSDEKTYTLNWCDKEVDLDSCSNSCKLIQPNTTRFYQNENEKKILMTTEFLGKTKETVSLTFEKCTIFNKDNWECRSNDKFSWEKQEMINGHFRYRINYLEKEKPNYMCTK